MEENKLEIISDIAVAVFFYYYYLFRVTYRPMKLPQYTPLLINMNRK